LVLLNVKLWIGLFAVALLGLWLIKTMFKYLYTQTELQSERLRSDTNKVLADFQLDLNSQLVATTANTKKQIDELETKLSAQGVFLKRQIDDLKPETELTLQDSYNLGKIGAIGIGYPVMASSIYDEGTGTDRIRIDYDGGSRAHAWCAREKDQNPWV
jgi:hypothetical protein